MLDLQLLRGSPEVGGKSVCRLSLKSDIRVNNALDAGDVGILLNFFNLQKGPNFSGNLGIDNCSVDVCDCPRSFRISELVTDFLHFLPGTQLKFFGHCILENRTPIGRFGHPLVFRETEFVVPNVQRCLPWVQP